jgi:RHS repeat-associated protein
LQEVDPAVGSDRNYSYDTAGNNTTVAERGLEYLDYGEDGRVEKLRKKNSVTMTYDGRGFLAGGWKPDPGGNPAYGSGVEPIYSSDGTLYLLRQIEAGFALNMFDNHVFYFGGRPVATLETSSTPAADVWKYLITDHLGTPAIAIDDSGTTVWSGGFEPFGRDYQAGTANGALANDVFLRLPGQWEDELWAPETIWAPVYYNVNRWYEPGTGRYSRTDPLGVGSPSFLTRNLYTFGNSNPSVYFDPLGLDAITDDEGIQDCSYCLYKLGGWGNRKGYERAMLVFCDDTGKRCMILPADGPGTGGTSARTKAKVGLPMSEWDKLCAIIHTHPRAGTTRADDPGDMKQARKAKQGRGVPIYVIHPTGGITKWDPATPELPSQQMAEPSWTEGPKERCGGEPCAGIDVP